jgi:hypothetical protein
MELLAVEELLATREQNGYSKYMSAVSFVNMKKKG